MIWGIICPDNAMCKNKITLVFISIPQNSTLKSVPATGMHHRMHATHLPLKGTHWSQSLDSVTLEFHLHEYRWYIKYTQWNSWLITYNVYLQCTIIVSRPTHAKARILNWLQTVLESDTPIVWVWVNCFTVPKLLYRKNTVAILCDTYAGC